MSMSKITAIMNSVPRSCPEVCRFLQKKKKKKKKKKKNQTTNKRKRKERVQSRALSGTSCQIDLSDSTPVDVTAACRYLVLGWQLRYERRVVVIGHSRISQCPAFGRFSFFFPLLLLQARRAGYVSVDAGPRNYFRTR